MKSINDVLYSKRLSDIRKKYYGKNVWLIWGRTIYNILLYIEELFLC